MKKYLDLRSLLNNKGITGDVERNGGDFDAAGRSYPREELRKGGLAGAQSIGDDGKYDNVTCEGQIVSVPFRAKIIGCAFVGATETVEFKDGVLLLDSSGEREEVAIALTGWLQLAAKFGESCEAQSSHIHLPETDKYGVAARLWKCETRTAEMFQCAGLHLPVNPLIHIFAIELQIAEETKL